MTRARDVADAGHATTATTADTISQKTSIDLSGTYSTHQLLVADAYNFAGDLTVNDHLILGKLSDDGNDFVLEGSHTLQGTGQLEAGYISSSGIGSVDGMTGTLGSGVTLGSGATIDSGVTGTLGSGVSFPAGHIIQFVTATGNAASIAGQRSSYITTNVTGSITPKLAGSKIYVHAVFNIGILVTSSAGDSLYTNIYRSGSSVTDEYIETDGYDVYFEAAPRTSNAQWAARNPIAWYDTPAHSNTTDAITYTVYVKGGNASGCHVQIHKGHGKWTFQMMEIMQ